MPTESPRIRSTRLAVDRRAVAAGLVLIAVVLAGATLLARTLRYEGRILPGVAAAGVELGGLTPEEAAAKLASALPGASAPITLRDPGDPSDPADDRSWIVPRGELGLTIDAALVADRAYAQGRTGMPLLAALRVMVRGRDVPASALFDADAARRALERLAPEVDLPPVDGDVTVQDGKVIVRRPVSGRQLDVEAMLAVLEELAADGRRDTVDIVTAGTAPRFGNVDSVADAYRRIVSGPVNLTWRQGQRLSASRDQVAQWVTIRRVTQPSGETAPAIVFDEAAIKAWLIENAQGVEQSPRNARLTYDEVTGKVSAIEPSRPGQLVDMDGSVRRFEDAAYTDVRTAELAVETRSPAVTSDAVGKLQGKVRVLLRSASRITGQPQGRATNVLLAAATLNGVTLGPGEEFSMLDALGTVSAETGYDMVQVDAGGGTLGGGVEQVTTGLFRAALWAGLVITERHSPAGRAAWVEPPIGLDAAVMPPDVDLRFVNATSGILIVGCAVDEGRGALVTSLVGAPPVRRVTLIGPVVKALVAPGPIEVRYDPRLEPGARTQVQWARHGGDVAWQRIVADAEAELFRDAFTARYGPAPDVEVVGAGR